VPFKGGGPATADTMAGHTQMYLGTLVTVMSYIKAKRLKLIATGGVQRNPLVPEVPTIAETVPGFESRLWWGIFAPPKTPADIIGRFHAETLDVMSTPDFQKRLAEQGGDIHKMSSAEFGKVMRSEQNKWLKVIRDAGIKGE